MFFFSNYLTKEIVRTKVADSCSPAVKGLDIDKHKALLPAENVRKPRLLFGKSIKNSRW